MLENRELKLKLEIETLNLLYRQNIPGALALLLYASTYAYICRSTMEPWFLQAWFSMAVLTVIVRLLSSWKWREARFRIRNLSEVKPWFLLIQGSVLFSGITWGIAGWLGSRSPELYQQVFTAFAVVFMAAGALVCWCVSRRTMLIVAIPTMIPWCLGLLTSSDSRIQVLGVAALIYFFLGLKVSNTLSQFVGSSLKLSLENADLTQELQQEIFIKNQAEETLHMALTSSDAIVWTWDVNEDQFICKGDLKHSLGQDFKFFTGHLETFISEFIYQPDQEKLKKSVTHVATIGGDLDGDFRVRWPDGEIHTLALRGKVSAEKDGLITHLGGIAWDATAKKMQEKLQKERDIHEAANQAKSVFLANASHEIRTPLAAISGFAESLLQSAHDETQKPEQLKSDLKAIARNSKFLTSLVNDLLDLSKIETGRFYVQNEKMSVASEIEESILIVRPFLDEKKLSLQILVDKNIPDTIVCDPVRFRQIIVNLLTNSIKFTKNGGITITVRRSFEDENVLSVRIRDTGIGIESSMRTQLFEPFVRGSSIDVQNVSGSGLGLALSKKLSTLLGGDLRLVSSQEGVGSEFELLLKTDLHFVPVTSSSVSQKILKGQLQDAKVLVVDDAIDLQVLMRRYLEKQGASVDTCSNGEEALEAVSDKNYDVILMDMKMPIMDGYQTTARLRQMGYKKPIIAVTAHANSEDRQRSLDVGSDGYLSKPVDMGSLIATIRHHLNNPLLN